LKKLKIALLIDWYLPGTRAGGPVRSVYSLLNLLKNDFDFYVITINTDLGTSKPYDNVKPNELLEQENVHYYYFSSERLNKNNLLSLLNKVTPDIIYTNSFWSFPFSIQVVRAASAQVLKVPVILAPRGMLGKGALGLKALKKKIFINLAKIFGWYDRVTFHATQLQEERDILDIFPAARIIKAPNINATAPTKNSSVKSAGHLDLFFLSRISVVKNLHFALEVLRLIPSSVTIKYDIYGNTEDGDYWTKCEEIIAQLPRHITVSLKGEIPFDKVPQVISKYNVLFLPTLNENYGHSIVESLLCGCPVVISDQTPWNDLENHNAGFALPLTNANKFAECLHLLAMEDLQQFKARSDAAINYISEKIDLKVTVQLYKNLFDGSAGH
jgi:glycosyltransferase involved in cell wall biosynthesis